MIFYGILLFYLLLVVASALVFWRRHSGAYYSEKVFVFPLKSSMIFRYNKAKVSRFVTRYECPECGYEMGEHKAHCPRCKKEGKMVPMEARTLVLQA